MPALQRANAVIIDYQGYDLPDDIKDAIHTIGEEWHNDAFHEWKLMPVQANDTSARNRLNIWLHQNGVTYDDRIFIDFRW